MPPFMQITDRTRGESECEGSVLIAVAIRSRLGREGVDLVHRSGQVRIRPQIRRDFLRARFIDTDLRRPECGVVGLKTVANLLPCKVLWLRQYSGSKRSHEQAPSQFEAHR